MQPTLIKGGGALAVFVVSEVINSLAHVAEVFKLLSPPVAFVVLVYTLYNLHLDASRKRREEREKKHHDSPDGV